MSPWKEQTRSRSATKLTSTRPSLLLFLLPRSSPSNIMSQRSSRMHRLKRSRKTILLVSFSDLPLRRPLSSTHRELVVSADQRVIPFSPSFSPKLFLPRATSPSSLLTLKSPRSSKLRTRKSSNHHLLIRRSGKLATHPLPSDSFSILRLPKFLLSLVS